METLKNKQFWISTISIFAAVTAFSWLFNRGWDLFQGTISFDQAFEGFEIRPIWIVLSLAIAFYNTRKSLKA